MTRKECPKGYFKHMTNVVRSVFLAENKLRAEGVLTKETCKGKNAEWYIGKVVEELISKIDVKDIE